MYRLTALCVLLALPGCARVLHTRTYSVPGSTMAPTIVAGDRIRCSTRVPAVVPRRSVVVFEGNGDWRVPGQTLIKRVIGKPGETIASPYGKVVTIDGQLLEEPYITVEAGDKFEAMTVPDASYFVMGDNRDFSSDSRYNGPIAHAWIKGVCTEIVSPRAHRGRIAGT